MGKLLASVAAALLMATAGGAEAKCEHILLAELPVEIQGHAVVAGTIDSQPARIVVDTGAAFTSVSPGLAARLRLGVQPYAELRSNGVGGESAIGWTHLDSFSVGSLTARNQNVAVTGSSAAINSIDMLLGADFLLQKSVDLELDLPHKAVRLIRTQGCSADEMVYWNGAYAVGPLVDQDYPGIVTEMRVNGVPLKALLDTGATTLISGQGARKLGVVVPTSSSSGAEVVHGVGRNGAYITPVQMKEFAFNQEVIKNPVIPVGDLFQVRREAPMGSLIKQDSLNVPDMLVGIDFMLAHRIYVARSLGRLYVSYVGGPAFFADAGKAAP